MVTKIAAVVPRLLPAGKQQHEGMRNIKYSGETKLGLVRMSYFQVR